MLCKYSNDDNKNNNNNRRNDNRNSNNNDNAAVVKTLLWNELEEAGACRQIGSIILMFSHERHEIHWFNESLEKYEIVSLPKRWVEKYCYFHSKLVPIGFFIYLF